VSRPVQERHEPAAASSWSLLSSDADPVAQNGSTQAEIR
jgi:hypothetical protein